MITLSLLDYLTRSELAVEWRIILETRIES